MIKFKKIIIVFFLLFSIFILTGCKDKINSQKLSHGTLLDFKVVCLEFDNGEECINNVAVLKAKITPSITNKYTIDQNYYNIEDFIKNNNTEKYSEIQYWAIADMSNGNEEKVISFTVNKDLIEKIKNNKVATNKLGNYVNDLYIHQSLK